MRCQAPDTGDDEKPLEIGFFYRRREILTLRGSMN